MNNGEFQAHTEQIERLVQRVSALADDDARNTALELLQSLMDLHGAALSRVVEVLTEAGDAGRNSLAKLGNDPLICGLLVLYGVHPVPLEDRVARAIEKVAPQLRKHGGTVELLGVADAVVRVKLQSFGERLRLVAGRAEDHGRAGDPGSCSRGRQVVAEGVPSHPAFVPLNMIQASQRKRRRNMKNPPPDIDAHTSGTKRGEEWAYEGQQRTGTRGRRAHFP